ncbi:MAG TPA: host attachment protein [Alphaproteobacteria bacterium]|nr:host attachment protein [Alphaproteobacteria bacterium]
MAKTRRTWVMIADAACARFFMTEGHDILPVDGAVLENPAAHGHSRDLVSDRPGRTIESVGGAHHAQEPRTDPHRAAKADFAKRVADYVETNAAANKFDDLVMVAPPQMLGDLRGALGRQASARLAGTAAKDLMKIPAAEMKAHLQPILDDPGVRRHRTA